MKSNKYLYGDITVPSLPTKIINERIKLLKVNRDRLLEEHYLYRDNSRLNAVLKAISFWENLIYNKDL